MPVIIYSFLIYSVKGIKVAYALRTQGITYQGVKYQGEGQDDCPLQNTIT